MSKQEQAVLISGGSKGLGLSLVQDCLRRGWRVGTFSRRATPAVKKLAQEYPEAFHYFEGDLSSAALPAEAVQQMKARFGRLDALVNNAAIAHDGLLPTFPPERIAELVHVNITAGLQLTRECAREFLRMPAEVPKSVIQISSVVGITGFRGLSVYAATKSAMLGFTRSLARELGPANITVNAVLPGFLETEMSGSMSDSQRNQITRRTPMGRLGNGDDVAPLVAFLMGPEARFITGQYFVIDGGASC